MKAGLVALLTAQTSISNVVGSRVYVNHVPQTAAFPHIVITQMGSNENVTMDGQSGDFRFVTFDIDCKAKGSVQVEALAKTVRRFLDDYTGAAGSYVIDAVIMNGEADDLEPPSDGSDVPTHVITIDCDIQYHET